MSDPQVQRLKLATCLGAVVGVGLVVWGVVIKASDFALAPQRRGRSVALSGESAQEYAFFPLILGAIVLIGCLVYWWTDIRPLRDD